MTTATTADSRLPSRRQWRSGWKRKRTRRSCDQRPANTVFPSPSCARSSRSTADPRFVDSRAQGARSEVQAGLRPGRESGRQSLECDVDFSPFVVDDQVELEWL